MLFKVYVDYTQEIEPRPFYVGKGKDDRVRCIKRNNHHQNIVKKHGIDRRIVFETDDESEAFSKERQLISELNTFVYADGSWGANLTLGGEGVSGRVGELHPLWKKHHSEVSKKKNSESNKLACAGEKNGMFGKHHTKETRKKIGDNQRGWKQTTEAKALISKALKGKTHVCSDESKKKISESRKGKEPWNKGKKFGKRKTPRVFSEEARKNISAGCKGRIPWNKGKKKTDGTLISVEDDATTLASKIL